MRHCLGGPGGLHRGLELVHVGNLHHHSDASRVLGVYKLPDTGDPEGAEKLLAHWRREPVFAVLHVVIADYSHGNSIRLCTLRWDRHGHPTVRPTWETRRRSFNRQQPWRRCAEVHAPRPGWKARNWSTVLRLSQYEGRPTAVAVGRARRSLRPLARPPLNGDIVGQTGNHHGW